VNDVRIGLFGIGLDAYRPQFIALEERLEGYVGEVQRKLGCPAIKVEKLGRLRSTETVRAC
jgi:L-arabinose isomerase